MIWKHKGYFITDTRESADVDYIVSVLKTTYWARERPAELIRKSINNSVIFSLFSESSKQAGLARVVTDYAAFSWICDVFISPEHRGKGLGKWLMNCVMSHPSTKVRMCMLGTKDAHGLYEQSGFDSGKEFMSCIKNYSELV